MFFLVATAAALALRLFFVFHFPRVAGDTFIYGDIAKNWLAHGTFSVSDEAIIRPTLIRLPGYPAFLATVFSIFGREHYTAVMVVQALIDTNTCLVIAALALELMSDRAAKAAYLLAATCPFTASYVAAPLTETLAIFCAAHALYYGVRGIKSLSSGQPSQWVCLLAGLWTAAGILLRPDGGLVLAALILGLAMLLLRGTNRRHIILAGALVVCVSLAPLLPWTLRNWRTFHVIQPLAPRYANDPGEFVPLGFNRWVRTWLADYVSVDELYWAVSGDPLDFKLLPERAFDSREQFEATRAIISQYNQQLYIDPELDASFEKIASDRVHRSALRYYVWLPVLRIANMWLRPRTELLPIELRWWEFEDTGESVFALFWAGLNAFYLLAALRGWFNWQLGVCGAMLAGFVLLRSAFLGTLENPEPRYVLECFPIVLAFAGGAFARGSTK